MPYIDHIRRCTRHDLTDLVAWRIADHKVGYVDGRLARRLLDFPTVFERQGDDITLTSALATVAERSRAVDEVVARLREDGLIGAARAEAYAVKSHVGAPPLMTLDRGAAGRFGIICTGFHLNGTVGNGADTRMWIARRARNKTTFPGRLDNMVAGGQPAGLTVAQNLIKECQEEAGLPEHIARRAVPAGLVSYTMQSGDQLLRHAMHVFDLDVPHDFTPFPADGEVESFSLMPIDVVAGTVRSSLDTFKNNCNLVIIDFLMRKGLISPLCRDYFEIATGLRGKFP